MRALLPPQLAPQNSPTWLLAQMHTRPSLVPSAPQLPSQNLPAKLSLQSTQVPPLHDPDARAPSMLVWSPRWLQAHLCWQKSPTQSSVHLTQPRPSAVAPPWSVQLPSHRAPTNKSGQAQMPL